MKTPRELLFEPHQNAEPDLDQIRRDVLKSMAAELRQPRPRFAVLSWLRALGLTPPRRLQIAGLAAVWVVIVALNVPTTDDASKRIATAQGSPGAGVSLAWREYRRQLSEALESQPAVAAAKPDQRSFLTPKTLNSISNV
jgi:hypothetical protein